ncbi:hypothetical protein C8J56DRAFT_895370 [Mycena floridula]|nr:hypothetical protein C8J56DRAFT_895370 [Mycena floridula]
MTQIALSLPLLVKYKTQVKLAAVFAEQLHAQFGADRAPFKAGRGPEVDSYKWWKKLQSDEDTDVLTVIVTKILAVLPNSMADERTGSKITWFDSALRSCQNPMSLIDMIMIGQWYGTHLPCLRLKNFVEDVSEMGFPRGNQNGNCAVR